MIKTIARIVPTPTYIAVLLVSRPASCVIPYTRSRRG
jgi:hypothetical protein